MWVTFWKETFERDYVKRSDCDAAMRVAENSNKVFAIAQLDLIESLIPAIEKGLSWSINESDNEGESLCREALERANHRIGILKNIAASSKTESE